MNTDTTYCFGCHRPFGALNLWCRYSYERGIYTGNMCSIDCMLKLAGKNPSQKSYLPRILIDSHRTDRTEVIKELSRLLDNCHRQFHTSNSKWNTRRIGNSIIRKKYDDPVAWMAAFQRLRQISMRLPPDH